MDLEELHGLHQRAPQHCVEHYETGLPCRPRFGVSWPSDRRIARRMSPAFCTLARSGTDSCEMERKRRTGDTAVRMSRWRTVFCG